ncbi:MAG: 2-hydroxy-4-carboxymuconate semialdehyde hemiacetal dehydrogenase [Acidimicrobiales bacterium]|jgi:2-hydroxy-4-carboxymuconate semialdehyde hemiacetal dehydrogenase
MKIVLAGEGAIAQKHAAALGRINDVEIVSVAGGNAADTEAFATELGATHWSTDLAECLAQDGVEAAVLATPTQLHAAQAIQVLDAGKHVLVEIPMSDSLADAEALVAAQKRTGLTAMVCHTRRFNPSHQWMKNRIDRGELTLQHLVVDTFFFRRENKNALGKPRTWTDHLLWHHSCHTVDLFQHQTGMPTAAAWAQQGPIHPELGIAMDMSIGLRSETDQLCTLSLSFNNDGPLGTFFRYICDNGTYIARYDELVDGNEDAVDLSGTVVGPDGNDITDGIEAQDREFFAAIATGREPNASVQQCLPVMATIDQMERRLNQVSSPNERSQGAGR